MQNILLGRSLKKPETFRQRKVKSIGRLIVRKPQRFEKIFLLSFRIAVKSGILSADNFFINVKLNVIFKQTTCFNEVKTKTSSTTL